MANRWTQNLTEKDITPESDFLNRRQVVKSLAGIGLAGLGLAAGTSSSLAKGSDTLTLGKRLLAIIITMSLELVRMIRYGMHIN